MSQRTPRESPNRGSVGLKSDGTTGQTTEHLAARDLQAVIWPVARQRDRRLNWRRYRPTTCYTVTLQYIYWWTNLNFKLKTWWRTT